MDYTTQLIKSMQMNNPALDIIKSLQMSNPTMKMIKSLQMTNPAFEAMKSMQMNNPTMQMIKSLQMTNPAFEAMKSMRMNNPTMQMIKSLQMTNPAFEAMKSMQMNNPTMQMIKSLQMTNPALDVMKTMKMNNPTLQIIKSMQMNNNNLDIIKKMKMTNPVYSYKESILELQNTKPLINNLKKTFQNNSTILTTFNDLDESIDKVIKHSVSIDKLDSDEIKVNTDGTVSLSTYSTTQDEIIDVINSIFSKAFENQNMKLNEISEAILADVNSLKDTKMKKIVNQWIIPLFISLTFMFITPFANLYLDNYIHQNKKLFKKFISSDLISNIDNEQHLNYLRIIKTDNLEVKFNASRKSKCIANLKFGEIVLVLKKSRDWSFIQKNNEDGEIIIQGWVFSRYLEKIKF